MAESKTTRRRRKTEATDAVSDKVAADAADALFRTPEIQVSDGSAFVNPDAFPVMAPGFEAITRTVFAEVSDPKALYDKLNKELTVSVSLTPGALVDAANKAEANARDAHKLYVVGRADYERFDLEREKIEATMREVAREHLEQEKASGVRRKQITDADVRQEASRRFPDEWADIQRRHVEREAVLDHLKRIAELWQQRCFTLSGMINAGKRA